MKRLIYVFKAVFGQDNDRSKKALILLLNTILDRKDDPITRIRILNPYNHRPK